MPNSQNNRFLTYIRVTVLSVRTHFSTLTFNERITLLITLFFGGLSWYLALGANSLSKAQFQLSIRQDSAAAQDTKMAELLNTTVRVLEEQRVLDTVARRQLIELSAQVALLNGQLHFLQKADARAVDDSLSKRFVDRMNLQSAVTNLLREEAIHFNTSDTLIRSDPYTRENDFDLFMQKLDRILSNPAITEHNKSRKLLLQERSLLRSILAFDQETSSQHLDNPARSEFLERAWSETVTKVYECIKQLDRDIRRSN